MQILILCGIYAVELSCYRMGLQILFETRFKTKTWMHAGLIFPVLIGMLPVDAAGKNVFVSLSVLIVVFFSMEGKILEKGIVSALIFLLLICIDNLYTSLPQWVAFSSKSRYKLNISYFEEKCWEGIVVIAFNFIKNKLLKLKKVHINSIIYFLLGIILLSVLFSLGALRYAKTYLTNVKFKNFCNVLDVTSSISIFLLIVFIVYIKSTHERMEELLKMEQLMKESQVNYYKQLLQKESKTRRYRHDMVNHLVYLQEILKNGHTENARNYVEEILGGFQKIQKTYYMTGNEMVDTIMNYFLGMLPENVKIDIQGRYPVELAMEEMDICTIFSNVFLNAVEEIKEHPLQKSVIQVEITKGKQYIEYIIRNSMYTDVVTGRNGLPESKKADKKNHGIGMVNVKETVERNEGRFKWCKEDGYFCVTLTLPVNNITVYGEK